MVSLNRSVQLNKESDRSAVPYAMRDRISQ